MTLELYNYLMENITVSIERISFKKNPWYFFNGKSLDDAVPRHTLQTKQLIQEKLSNFPELIYWYSQFPITKEFIVQGRWGFYSFQEICLPNQQSHDIAISYINNTKIRLLSIKKDKLLLRTEELSDYKPFTYGKTSDMLECTLDEFKKRLEDAKD
tara:strand:- start:9 stop:476 length:468 start_codon:yes stop_codon:yes gene_type:complete